MLKWYSTVSVSDLQPQWLPRCQNANLQYHFLPTCVLML